jgi:transposase
LEEGDTLVIDNASVHIAADTAERLNGLLNAAGIRILTLPTYSPELNPVELVFAQVKRWIWTHRGRDEELWHAIARGFSHVTLRNIIHYYAHCRNLK